MPDTTAEQVRALLTEAIGTLDELVVQEVRVAWVERGGKLVPQVTIVLDAPEP
jgi:hypothetical protein